MKIYLAGSISGGRDFLEGLKLICEALKDMGHQVLSENFVVNFNPDDWGETRDMGSIVQRDLSKIGEADAFIAEVSQSSHGVGYEHAHAESLGKPVLLLRHRSLSFESWRSVFLGGTKVRYDKVRFVYYMDKDIYESLEGFFREFFPETVEGRVVRERQI